MKKMRHDILIRIYAELYSENHLANRLFTPFRRICRGLAKRFQPTLMNKAVADPYIQRHSERLIVSLTSFPARINTVWQVVKCMMCQTYHPDKIILWLSREQFPKMDDIPENLLKLRGELFDIRFVENDLRSHKKHYYAFQEFPDDLIFLIDDDIYYPSDLLERVMNAHYENPKAVICNYGYIMRYDSKGNLLPYNKWTHVYKETDGINFFFGSGGGTLIQPKLLYKDVSNKDLFLNLTPQADDIWLNAMVKLENLPLRKLKLGLMLPVYTRKNVKLASSNLYDSQNDKQLSSVIYYYEHEISRNPFSKLEKKYI